MSHKAFMAFDLGAESGRAILGSLEAGRLKIAELHRFPNAPINLRGHLHWDLTRLFREVKKSLELCASSCGDTPESIGVDTWGVDFGLLDSDGRLLGLPYAYRDARTEGAMQQFLEIIPRERVYQLTGIQFLPFNTLFQLFSMVQEGSPLLQAASDLLFMPDLFNYLLTGEKRTEFTFATTSQLYNPLQQDWDNELFDALNIPKAIMQQVVAPGTVVGRLSRRLSGETGLPELPVVATASHDTAAAVAAAPTEGKDWAYISSGTWSLMGVESEAPIINDQALHNNYTNEGGVAGTFRVLRNIAGLWLVRECRRAWQSEKLYTYQELSQQAASADPFVAIIDPDDASFLNPPDMPEAIRQFCLQTNQPPPETTGAFIRCLLESLALRYRMGLQELREIYPSPINRIHVLGGGAQNEALCQFTANAVGLSVIAGPIEATAIGNLLVQGMALGHVDSLPMLRDIVARSFSLKRYEPKETGEWDSAYERFKEVRHRRVTAVPAGGELT